MWLLHYLPSGFILYAVDTMIVVGSILCLLSFLFFSRVTNWLPNLKSYNLLAQIIGVLMLTYGVYLKGGVDTELVWRGRVEAAENQVKVEQQKLQEALNQVRVEVHTVTNYVDRVHTKIKKEIVEKEVLINRGCTVSKEAIDVLNQSAVEGAKAKDSTTKEEIKE